jgi:hypothetical protein
MYSKAEICGGTGRRKRGREGHRRHRDPLLYLFNAIQEDRAGICDLKCTSIHPNMFERR